MDHNPTDTTTAQGLKSGTQATQGSKSGTQSSPTRHQQIQFGSDTETLYPYPPRAKPNRLNPDAGIPSRGKDTLRRGPSPAFFADGTSEREQAKGGPPPLFPSNVEVSASLQPPRHLVYHSSLKVVAQHIMVGHIQDASILSRFAHGLSKESPHGGSCPLCHELGPTGRRGPGGGSLPALGPPSQAFHHLVEAHAHVALRILHSVCMLAAASMESTSRGACPLCSKSPGGDALTLMTHIAEEHASTLLTLSKCPYNHPLSSLPAGCAKYDRHGAITCSICSSTPEVNPELQDKCHAAGVSRQWSTVLIREGHYEAGREKKEEARETARLAKETAQEAARMEKEAREADDVERKSKGSNERTPSRPPNSDRSEAASDSRFGR
eukprot:gene25721-11379_t